ncbi:hypothetical protein [Corallococcus sp. AB018]|uniref:hypothetical protein n=1 Tax=Corallococcus sp. AB018 TaxID=2316715 RepID=UPI000F88DB1F|nr:hypothetical protein [Corallococcus sp. AB018]
MLLHILEHVMTGAPSTDPAQDGTIATNAYDLNAMSPKEWLGVAKAQHAAQGEHWMRLGGRLLHIDTQLYVSDRGPAENRTKIVKDAFNDGIAPSYREIARRLKADGIDSPTMSKKFATNMRALLKNTNGGTRETHGNMLPVLTGAMFIAETRRNAKAFPINLMLLDFAEKMQTYGRAERKVFTWEKILWHPEAIDLDSGAPNPGPLARSSVAKKQAGPLHKGSTEVLTIGGLHRVGGKMPSSPTFGGSGGDPIGGGAAGFNYIHQKEASILIRWLALKNKAMKWEACTGTPNNASTLNHNINHHNYKTGDFKTATDQVIKNLNERISKWDLMLS